MRVLQKPSPQVDISPKGRGMKVKEGEDSTTPWTGGETHNKKKVPLAARSSKQGKGHAGKKLAVSYPKPKLKTSHTQNISTFVDSFVEEKVDSNKGKKGDKKKEDSSKAKKEKRRKKGMHLQMRRLTKNDAGKKDAHHVVAQIIRGILLLYAKQQFPKQQKMHQRKKQMRKKSTT
eukprot:8925807-Ditylum_brightwellii.AAC.1